MNQRFPRVGVIGAGQLARMMVAPATAIGVDLILYAQSAKDSGAQVTHHAIGDYTDLEALKKFAATCDVITFEHDLVPLSVIRGIEAIGVKVYPPSSAYIYSQNKAEMRKKLSAFSLEHAEIVHTKSELSVEELDSFDTEIAVMIARSPHQQATSWTPTEIVREAGVCTLTISPAQNISAELMQSAQKLALDIAKELGVIGVMAVEMLIKDNHIFLKQIATRPHNSFNWTIDGAVTNQFEQHLRAILDLPLGDPTMSAEIVVTGNIVGGEKTDMYRPYLHLMARNPELKFHQYKEEVRIGRTVGHVTAVGSDIQRLITDVQHARDYMSGAIDE